MGLLASFLKKKEKGIMDKEWSISLDSNITSQLTSGFIDEESIVLGTSSGKVYAINSAGKIKWVYSIAKSLSKEESFFLEEKKTRLFLLGLIPIVTLPFQSAHSVFSDQLQRARSLP